MFRTIVCTDSSIWLEIITTFGIPVHSEAVLDGIADVLQPWIDEGTLPADTNEVLAALIESKRGQHLTVWDAFPPFFKDQSKTHQELVDAGLIPFPSMS